MKQKKIVLNRQSDIFQRYQPIEISGAAATGVGAGKWIVDRIIAKRRAASGRGPDKDCFGGGMG